jgi:hypothetical protein
LVVLRRLDRYSIFLGDIQKEKTMRHTVHKAADGETFETAKECREHEKAAAVELLSGSQSGHIHQAINGHNEVLATAIRKIANMIPPRPRPPK